ncbi:uncharacterized protein LOC106659802 [Trichogramma pretiosum]|uniref:uncharacterized protein LOC106659802 n=1 Tax=Trichogramma pretiosum TaxID=7493 RepID=UPI0006C97983|nr:uncharacterized protein LOC106659802 [Trichogramma pretiosum]
MSKDVEALQSVSKYFTEESLRKIVAGAENKSEQEVEILSWSFGDASNKGDSYLSTVDRVVIQGKVDGKVVETRIVVKSLPNNIGRRKTYRSAEFFKNEINFYVEIATTYKEFLKSKNQSSVLLLPDCLDYHLDGKEDFIALEDVSPRGFGPSSRQNCPTYDEFVNILKAMARFHAVSFAYKDQNREHFKTLATSLSETYFRDDLYESWYKRFHERLIEIAQDALEKECSGSKAQKRFNSYAKGELYKKSADFCNEWHAETSVINQGDSWAPNFLVRNLPNGQIEVLMLDFQLARSASPVLDLSFLMYSCTEKPLRDQHFDNLLKIYHDELSRVVSLLGSDPQKVYSWATFMNEVQEKFVHGMTFGLESVVFSMLSSDESFDLDVIKDDKVDIADVWTVQNIKTSENRKRLTDVISHAFEKGYL